MLIGKVLSGLVHEFLKHNRTAKKKNLWFGSKSIISHPLRTMSSIKTHLLQSVRLHQFITPMSEVYLSCSTDLCFPTCFLMDIPRYMLLEWPARSGLFPGIPKHRFNFLSCCKLPIGLCTKPAFMLLPGIRMHHFHIYSLTVAATQLGHMKKPYRHSGWCDNREV